MTSEKPTRTVKKKFLIANKVSRVKKKIGLGATGLGGIGIWLATRKK